MKEDTTTPHYLEPGKAAAWALRPGWNHCASTVLRAWEYLFQSYLIYYWYWYIYWLLFFWNVTDIAICFYPWSSLSIIFGWRIRRIVRTTGPLTDHVTVSLVIFVAQGSLVVVGVSGRSSIKITECIQLSFFIVIFSGLCRVWKHDFVAGNLVDDSSAPIFHILVLEDVWRFYSRKDDEKKHSFRELEREVRAPNGLRHVGRRLPFEDRSSKELVPSRFAKSDLFCLT